VSLPSENLPTISIVTPTYNHGHLLETAIRSVLDQGYPSLEYVVVDGGSTDNTGEILERYSAQLHHVISEPDRGAHDALDKGYAVTSGEVMGWLNADDVLLPGSLHLVGRIFSEFPEVRWLTGMHMAISPDGEPAIVTPAPRWSRWHLLSRYASFRLAQESTFWHRELWEMVGATMDPYANEEPVEDTASGERVLYRAPLDFELWARFSRFAQLHSVRAPLGCFRWVEGQESVAKKDLLDQAIDAVRERERPRTTGERVAARVADFSFQARRFTAFQRVTAGLFGTPPYIGFDPATLTYKYRPAPERVLTPVVRGLLGLRP